MMFIGSSKHMPWLLRARKRKVSRCTYLVILTTTKICLDDSRPVSLLHCSCSCVAGTTLCNHVVALLYQTAHYSQLRVPAVPPVLSCTESEQQWHKPRTLGVKPGPVDKMAVLSARPKQRAVFEGVRSTLYKAVCGDLPDLSVLRVSEVYRDFPPQTAPLITTMGISQDHPLVESAFGMVQAGSPLSYQQPVAKDYIAPCHDAPLPPAVPLVVYRLASSDCMFVCSEKEQLHLKSLTMTWEMAHKVECATRKQSECGEWHQLRKPRLTSSRFREICSIRGQSSGEHLADRILKGSYQTSAMRRGIAMEPAALQEYSQTRHVNVYPCGFVVHPDAPWMGSSPDGLVYDPTENPQYGLVEVKCPNVKSYVDCSYLEAKQGTLQLKRHHNYYWQIQGQMLITGMDWCDFVVFAEEDMLVQRILKDAEVINTIKQKVDHFFFYIYMPRCL
ncbi:uncharacterized protein LOC143526239 isoform X2 [Brachyhypopomus gauderio]|uniref:uncharacterized protein LOC143488781 isoform X2 n=1 Tax=Brachyhypopomus gauderio TaxID=698409 RepID=UPI004041C7FA